MTSVAWARIEGDRHPDPAGGPQVDHEVERGRQLDRRVGSGSVNPRISGRSSPREAAGRSTSPLALTDYAGARGHQHQDKRDRERAAGHGFACSIAG
jgi:hypothetical protein